MRFWPICRGDDRDPATEALVDLVAELREPPCFCADPFAFVEGPQAPLHVVHSEVTSLDRSRLSEPTVGFRVRVNRARVRATLLAHMASSDARFEPSVERLARDLEERSARVVRAGLDLARIRPSQIEQTP